VFEKSKTFAWATACGGEWPAKGCFTGPKLCQHGADECLADVLEACVMDAYPDPSVYAPFITCFEGEHGADVSAAKSCAAAAALDYTPVAKCLGDDNKTAALDAKMAKATAKLGAAKLGTPWVVLNGKNIDPTSLLDQVCAALDAPKPAGCGSGASAARQAAATVAGSGAPVRLC